MNNPNIYNVEGDNMLSPGLQPLTTKRKYVKNLCFFSVRFCNCIFYTGNYFVVFCKRKYSSNKHLI